MHVSRAGDAAAVATIDPALIDYVQICDGPLATPSAEAYLEEALHERMVPGAGEMPLVEMLRHIRPDVVVSAEVPLRKLREAGMSDLDRARLVAAGARDVMRAARA
jgi:sugar phosphate isomerase/epimerase